MSRLVSRLVLPVGDPEAFLRDLGERLPDMVPADAGIATETVLDLYGSAARLAFEGGRLRVEVEGTEAGSHGIAKGAVAYYVQAILGETCPDLVWTGDGAGTTVLAHFREMRVVSTESITPRMRRVRLAGADLARFAVGGLHIRLLLPPAGRVPVWPHAGPAALPVWPEGEDELTTRVYTIRRIDPDAGHLDIDVALHEPPSVGCRWALEAKAGDVVGILGPGGGGAGEADWHLLLGDETALPAIARILEELPGDARGHAFVEVEDAAEEQPLRKPEGVDLRWLHRKGRPAGTTTLLEDAANAIAWPQTLSVFVWAAAEFAAFKALRRLCRRERGLKRQQHLVVAYWRLGQRQGEGSKSGDED